MARVLIEHLNKVFSTSKKAEPVYAVRDLNLEIKEGEFVVLVGPSGCGKSTTLRLIAGLEEITDGVIKIGDTVVNKVEPKDRDIAMVFQNYALYPHMTVYENMAFGLELRRVPREEISRRVQSAAEMLNLQGLLDRLPKALSGGQRQRVAVGRAIVRQPKVFLFDEPLSNLDAQMRLQMRTELSRLHKQLRATMVYVTHDQAEAMTLGDRIVVMRDGRLQQVADPVELYRNPANRFVAGFMGSPAMNFFSGSTLQREGKVWFQQPGTTAGERAFEVELPASAPVGHKVVLGVRPEFVTQPAVPGSAPIEGVVELVELMGAETLVHLSRGAERFIARVPFLVRFEVGARESFGVDTSQLCLFDAQSGDRIALTTLRS